MKIIYNGMANFDMELRVVRKKDIRCLTYEETYWKHYGGKILEKLIKKFNLNLLVHHDKWLTGSLKKLFRIEHFLDTPKNVFG